MLVKAVLRVVLVDINPDVVRAWRHAFSDLPEVQLVQGSILDQKVDAWVTPTNARGNMDGGVDAVIKQHLGAGIEKKVQGEIKKQYNGHMPVGCATCVPTGKETPKYLISTPTMVTSAEDISDTLNVALACAAAFQMIHIHNSKGEGLISSVAIPGLGVGTGQVPVRVCANLMWTGYTLFSEYEFKDFVSMRAALQGQLGEQTLGEETRFRVVPPA
jgi:O-acetyl-ADP-ribose deacetylase (regulator of RNase III)